MQASDTGHVVPRKILVWELSNRTNGQSGPIKVKKDISVESSIQKSELRYVSPEHGYF